MNGRRTLTFVVVGALVGGIAWVALRSIEPRYQGKSLSAWLDEAFQNKEFSDFFADAKINTPAANAIRAMGKDSLPFFVRLAKIRDTALRRNLIKFSESQSWISMHPQPFDHIQMKAAFGFMVLGPAAKPAVPDLIHLLNDSAPELRVIGAAALGKIGPDAREAIPALQKVIDNALRRNPS